MQQLRAEGHSSRVDAVAADISARDAVGDFLAFLAHSGSVDEPSLQRAAEARRQIGQRIDVILTELGLMSAEALIQALAQFFQLPIVDRADLPQEPVLAGVLEPEFLRRNRVLPLAASDQDLVMGIDDPFERGTLAAIGYYLDRAVTARLLRPRDLEDGLDRLYGEGPSRIGGHADDDGIFVHADDIQRLKDAASEAPIIRLVNRLLGAAVERGASDVHIEPQANALIVRYRLDGVLAEVERLTPEVLAGVSTRIKILAKLNIAERRLPQDGRIKIMVAGRQVDVRVSFMPTQHGEGVVLRLLDKERVDLSFAALGLDGHARRILERLLAEPNGIILVTGPTGSGKTTTLYAALRLLNSVERKVFSVEDPIEYQLTGINQIQVKPQIGLDFVDCLRSILRQDPDVIMLGEIRDVETARTAIQASLTGHLVLSTLHTNSAAASITRLIDMGLEDYLLASSLIGVIAQRLVRRLCRDCATPRASEPELMQRLVREMPGNTPGWDTAILKQPVGCATCRHTGYLGRTAIMEALPIDETVRSHIVRRSGDRQVEEAARAAGMETLLQSGLRKAFAGETSLEEVLKVARF